MVDKIEQLGAFSESSINFPSGEYVVDGDLQKILKSNCYLLLYNLIESSVRNGITEIHDFIKSENLAYKEVTEKIKKLWLLNDKSRSFMDSSIKDKTVAVNLYEVIKSVLEDNPLTLEPSNIPISGNLDAETIKKIIYMYGFHGNLGVSEKDIDPILNFIVKIRCDLAHGNTSFSEATSQIVWSKVVDDKDKLVKYLTHMLQNIDSYIDQKKYK